MSVTVPLEISREDVELLADALGELQNEALTDFIAGVLKKTQEVTENFPDFMEIREVNPFSVCDISIREGGF